jgi:hypothetical protein
MNPKHLAVGDEYDNDNTNSLGVGSPVSAREIS